ncbi:galectin-4 isoform X2 [Helicoverpa armigera]|uniref:galectin-4 isoform X2 n=1 Tax=Helicoverpa armigera TaxID=29058 RepID=UPI00308372BD
MSTEVSSSALVSNYLYSFGGIASKRQDTMTSICNPDLPCVHAIAVGINTVSNIRIQGSIPHKAQYFKINLICGDDIAFHFHPKFDKMEIVRNTCSAGVWGEDEKSGGMPLSRGDNFDILIASDEESIRVSINGQHFCEYIHRIPYRITRLEVHGDVNIYDIKCNNRSPSQDPYDQNMQCVHKIPGGICSSSKIRVQGSIPHDAKGIRIYLKCTSRKRVIFYINPRFDQMEVVRSMNNYSDKVWGKEEKIGGMPLSRGGNFDMQVAFNGQHFCEFVHRLGFLPIDELIINGELNVKLISL